MLTYSQAFWYGALQGVTEYLPISSSAHLILFPRFLGIADPGQAFDVFLHLGTLLATLFYFKAEWIQLYQSFFHKRKPVSLGFGALVIGSLPAVVLGGLFHYQIETTLRSESVIVWTLIIGGLLLWGVDRYSKVNVQTPSLRQMFLIGICQSLSLIPGMSRSGSTMIGGRLVGLDRVGATRVSFLLSAPITLAAVVFKFKDFFNIQEPIGPLILGCISSALFGFLAIKTLIRFVSKMGFGIFAVYRLVLALIVWKTMNT